MVDFQRRISRLILRVRYQVSLSVHDRRVQTRLQVGSAIALAVGFLLCTSLFTGLFDSIQPRFSDFISQPLEPSNQVVVVSIDDASLGVIGAWPWSGATLAALLENISTAHPRVIAVDLDLADSAEGEPLEQTLDRLPNVILPVEGVNAIQAPTSEAKLPYFDLAVGPSRVVTGPDLNAGHTFISPNADGIVRRIPAAIQAAGRRFSALGLAAVQLAVNGSVEPAAAQNGLTLGGARVPLDDQGRLILEFPSPSSLTTISAADLLLFHTSPDRLRDKIVLVGITSPGLGETFRTPLSVRNQRSYPVQIQADLVETLASGHWLADQDRLTQITMIFLVAILAGSTLIHIRLMSAAALAMLYFLAYLGYAIQKFGDGTLVQPLYPALAIFFTLAGTITYRYFAEERPRDRAKHLFRRHVGPESVDQVLGAFEIGELSVRGVRREVTVLYVDIHELAELNESLSAEATIQLLNEYSKLIVECMFRNHGSLVKQMGNTLLAVWNLPLNQIDHPRCALQAATEIREEIKEANLRRPRELAVSVAMGVATGSVVAGRIGAPGVAEYTIVGEVVTIAERLAARRDGTVFMNQAAYEQGGKEMETRELNPMRLRRKTDPLAVWELVEPMELEPVKATNDEEPA